MEKRQTGRIPPMVISVNLYEMMFNIATEMIINTALRVNIEILVPNPSWTTAVSELILLRMSPVLCLSKKPTSLFIKWIKMSYLRF